MKQWKVCSGSVFKNENINRCMQDFSVIYDMIGINNPSEEEIDTQVYYMYHICRHYNGYKILFRSLMMVTVKHMSHHTCT